MVKDFQDNKHFNRLLKNACKGTSIEPRELLKELLGLGYKKLSDMDFNLEDLKEIVSDLAESKENTTAHTLTSRTRKATEINKSKYIQEENNA